jgi:hypothetical protein
MKRVMRMSAGMKKEMMSRENECDLIAYKLVVFYVFIQIDIYVYEIVCAQLFNIYFIE